MIFESHAHYDDEAFDQDREELLQNMQNNGIGYVLNIGASIASTKATVALTKRYPFVYGAVGVHPSEVANLDEESFQWLKAQCGEDKIVAVGEIGLDYYWPEPAHDLQKQWFERQLELAGEEKLPVVIHSRDAAKDTLDILKAWSNKGQGGVIHCYSYSKEIAREYLNMDYYFGIGGVITFANAKKLREAVTYIPVEKLLLETDSPYLAPVPCRGKRNSSLNLPAIAAAIADIKGMACDELIAVTTENAKRLFAIT